MDLESLANFLREELLKSKLKLSSIETTTYFDEIGGIRTFDVQINADEIDKEKI